MKQIIVYAKVAILCVVVAFVLLVIWMNRGYRTRFWPWAVDAEVSTLWLMLATSVASVAVFWVTSKIRRVFFELAEVRRSKAAAEAAKAQAVRQAELAAAEQRIDEKLQRALGEKNSQDSKSD
ncbi:hypothetical protein RAS2_17940 [Phycisphaerae bacterium RAS2]|nr:hypothetical protein RAS2_17940 [Phycisphaerae bacterium RAS2]